MVNNFVTTKDMNLNFEDLFTTRVFYLNVFLTIFISKNNNLRVIFCKFMYNVTFSGILLFISRKHKIVA